MIIPGNHATTPNSGFLEELEQIKGPIEENEAKILFAKYLRHNPTAAAQILMGIQLYPIQHAMINSMFLRDFGLYVLSRGYSKTYTASIFAALYAVFNPGVKVGILAPTHRQSKFIFKHIEDFSKSAKGTFLAQCINPKGIKKNADAWEMSIGRSAIFSLPLSDGCVTASGLMTYKNGIIKLSDLLPQNLSDETKTVESNVEVLTSDNFQKTENFFYKGKQPTSRVKTKRGFEYEATGNHRFKVLTDNGIEWRRTDELKKDDLLVILKKETWFENAENINLDQCYALGAMIGDGSYTATRPEHMKLTSIDKEIINRAQKAFLYKFRYIADNYSYNIYSTEEKQSWLKFWGMKETLTKDKVLPQRILSASKECMRACLQGIFDTDGGVQVSHAKGGTSARVVLTNTSLFLLKQIQYILLHYGVVSTLRLKCEAGTPTHINDCYDLIITGNNSRNFAKNVGFYLTRKQDKLINGINEQVRTTSYSDNIPSIFLSKIMEFFKSRFKKGKFSIRHAGLSHLSGSKVLTKQYANKFIKYCEDNNIECDFLQTLKEIASDDYFYDPVVSIEDAGEQLVYDLSVPYNEEFVYNGFIAHNSRIRGYRFNLILIDEALLLSEQVVNEVIRPFLNVNLDPINRKKYIDASNKLIKSGDLTTEEAKKYALPNQKLICLSSASYTFEYLYKLLQDYENKILSKESENEISHCVFQLSYEMAPEGLLSKENIEEAKASMSSAQFGREYEARFTDDSASFFSPKKMREATILDGQYPCTMIIGDPKKEYILGIDPNSSDAETSDHFAMCLLELDNETRTATMVHGYACPKSNTAYRAQYLRYLLDYFNIVYIIVDNAGGKKFIEDCGLMPAFEGKMKLDFIEDDFLNEDKVKGLKNSKKTYNPAANKICHSQVFHSDWIRLANEHLQMCIERKRIMFASEIIPEKAFDDQKAAKIPIKDIYFDSLDDIFTEEENRAKQAEFIEHQAYIIKLTKTECALIEVSSTAQGRQTFDLPANLNRLKTPDRPRKDSYSALLLANWGAKCYWEMKDLTEARESFIPLNFG